MVANSSRKANLEMFLIKIAPAYYNCIVKKINVGEKQDKKKYSWFILGNRLRGKCTARLIPAARCFVVGSEHGCDKFTVWGERRVFAHLELSGRKLLSVGFLNTFGNGARCFGNRCWWRCRSCAR